MKLAKRILALMSLLLVVGVAAAKTPKNKSERVAIYAFGVAASFNDTITFITPIQQLDGASLGKYDMLEKRSAYSRQLKSYLTEQLSRPDYTSVLFFNKDAQKLQKQYDKYVQQHKKQNLTLIFIKSDDFSYQKAEESAL